MARQKLNVLVYTGPGTTVASVRQSIYTLRRLLSPNYAVIPLTETALLKEPWSSTAALLVIPGGADLHYCRLLNGPGNRIISDFVRRGGAYLGFCAGGYYGCARCEFEVGNPDKAMEVIGSRELAFFPGTCRGGAFKGFEYASESGARAVRVRVHEGTFEGSWELPETFRSYYNGGGVFVDAGTMKEKGIEVLASFDEELDVDGGDGKAAVVYCKIGQGRVVLTGPHPEFSAANLEPQPHIDRYDELVKALAEDEEHRTNFLTACLGKLGLEVRHENSSVPSLSKLHLSALDPQEAGGLLASFDDIITKDEQGEEFIKGENDTFRLEHSDSRWQVDDLRDALKAAHVDNNDNKQVREDPAKAAAIDGLIDYNKIVKTIVPHESAWPDPKETPYFNHHDFYSSLQEFRRRESEAYEWGDTLIYGEVVTSTNTLLEKNPKLLSKLPTGFTMAATTQTAGRGRGRNYIMAIAIVEAIRSYDGSPKGAYSDIPVKLKWPNDVYAQDPANPWGGENGKKPNYVKVGGILTNCAYSNGNYQLVVGVGINTTNARPTTSLNEVLSAFSQRHNLAPFRIERFLARLLTRFESLYREFVRHGFTRSMEERYYDSWLHSGQEVTLEAEGGVRAKVVGITTDWGLLRAQELGPDGRLTGRVWALQSDENSFDFWKGLVKRKV
ncbi:Biotin--protein ligase [Cytospora mali]|uniref:Biotin--protein ligase n=1 Tax=Cytospora mali TaxID=578113 RepID=A0A194UPL0_CYTMA|nr:Biotin--protein ligase [Valsa mali var. pyri (nom. inval.)]